MSIATYPDGSAESIDSFTALDTYLRAKLRNVEADLDDSEFCQHAGLNGIAKLTERRAGLNGVLSLIAPMVQREALGTAYVQAAEAEWKAAGYTGSPELALIERGNDGDR